MASDVSKTVAFLSSYSSELVQLDKHTLEALLKSNRASHVKEWKAAQNFWYRKLSTLLPEHREELDDWEFILCNMSKLEPAAFLPRLRRCFNRVDSFITERAEAIHKLACQNLETALQRKHMLQFPMSTFTRIFLERYKDKLETEQMEALSMWTENLCVMSASDRDAVTARRAARLISVQEFFAHFAAEIVGLQKQTLRDVVMSNESNKNLQWMNAKTFFRRDYVFLTVEEKDLLEDWELVLCDKSASESVAFLPRLRRCFKRVDSFIAERGEAIRKIGCKKLETALGSKHMSQFPMSTFTRIFLERSKDKLETEQMEALSMWTENLCVQSASERDATTARREARLKSVQQFFAHFAAEIVGLQKQTLRDVVLSNESNKNPQWLNAKTFFRRDYVFLTVEEKDLLEDWELVLCDKSASESVAFLPRLTRSFDRVKAVVGEQKEKLRLQKKVSLVDAFVSLDTQAMPMLCFCGVFLKRYVHRLGASQIAEVELWERDLCVSEKEHVDKFLEMLKRREAELKTLNATSVEQLFSGHRKKSDADLRFGYDFLRRSWTQLSLPQKKRVQQALQPFVVQVESCDPFLRHSFLPPSCKLEGRNLCFIRSLHTFAASAQVVKFHWMSCVSLLIASIHAQ